MGFLSVVHSDRGIKKNTNQDSVLIKEASTDYGDVMLAVVCDGMGGLAKGEVASAALIKAFSMWFDVNQRIADHGKISHIAMGTTAAVLLMAEGKYYTMNVGDSRVYKIDGQGMTQLTKDQTFVQKEIAAGRMTPDEARVHPQRNVLLQCVGASEVIIPEFTQGEYKSGEVYMLCSDGFRHVITEEEFYKLIDPEKMETERALKDAAVYCTELNKSRQEKDNISVILLKVC